MSYVALANITLGSSASSVTFSSIPATYRDLVLIYNGTNSDSNAGMLLRFNADSGSNYSDVAMLGFSGGTNSSTASGTSSNVFFGTTNQTFGSLNIMDYSATDKHKTVLARAGQPGGNEVRASAHRYASTSAITTVQVFRSGANISAGSTFALYAIAS